MAVAALSVQQEEHLLPPRFTADGRPETVALEARRNLGNIIDELSDDEINAIATSAEAHRASGQRVFLEVTYGEALGTTDAVLQFKKSQDSITAAYTFYKDEEEGQNKRLLRELKRMEYLEKVVMRQLETTDRANSIGVVQGMLRASSAFIKGLQNVFKQIEALSKSIETGLQNKTAMPTAEQKTAVIQAIQTALGKLQPSAPNHITIKNMVQQQLDVLLKNVAMPVMAARAEVKSTAAPLTPATQKNSIATSPVITTAKTTSPVAAQAVSAPSAQIITRTVMQAQTQLQAQPQTQIRVQPAARTVATTAAPQIASPRFSVLSIPAVAQRIQTQVAAQPPVQLATAAVQSRPLAAQPVTTRPTASQPLQSMPLPQAKAIATATPVMATAATPTPITAMPSTLRVVASNPHVQPTAAPASRHSFTIVESKAGQQVLSTVARSLPAQSAIPATQAVQATQVNVAPVTTATQTITPQQTVIQPTPSQPLAIQPTTQAPVSQATAPQAPISQAITQPISAQPTSTQLTTAQPTATAPATTPTRTISAQEQPRVNDAPAATTPQRPTAKQDTPRGDEAGKTNNTKSLLGKTEPEKDDKKSAFKANAKSACESCATKDCANCGVKTSTLFGVKTNTIPVLRHVPEAMIDKAKKMFGINAGKCAGCSGGNCASCGAARVTADTAKVSSRFANLNKPALQPTPK